MMNESTSHSNQVAATLDRTSEKTPVEKVGSDPPTSKKLGIVITQAAVDAVAVQIAKRGAAGTALRVGIRGGGCSG